MDKAQWAQVREIFDHIADKSPSHRRDYLDMVCDGQPELRTEVESLLTAHDGLDSAAPWERALQASVPEQIGEYVIEGTLGQGGIGTVYQAVHPLHGQVALKVQPPLTVANDIARQRFEREALVLQRLSHDCLCVVYEWFIGEQGAVIAMEHVRGQELRDLLNDGPLPLDQAIRVIDTLADVLQLAHANGILHRDLKPSNVLIDESNQLRLIDFGIAKFADERLTATGTILGSPHYMSPEQWRGEKLSTSSDLWSLGCLLYELVSGERAFNGDDLAAIAKQVTQGEAQPLPPHSVDGRSLQRVAHMLNRLLAKDVDQRYPDCAALLADLRAG